MLTEINTFIAKILTSHFYWGWLLGCYVTVLVCRKSVKRQAAKSVKIVEENGKEAIKKIEEFRRTGRH